MDGSLSSRRRKWNLSLGSAAILALAFGLLDSHLDSRALAQPAAAANAEAKRIRVTSPAAYQVFQRNGDNRANIPITLSHGLDSKAIVNVSVTSLSQQNGKPTPTDELPTGWSFRDGILKDVPTGGPYVIQVIYRDQAGDDALSISPIFVGDLWVLAGQSNMQGVGDLADVTPPSNRVSLLGMNGVWSKAEEPLHWLVDSPDPVHSGNPADRAARSEAEHRTRTKGTGLGLPFGVLMAEATKVPVGLVACAHGGTSMAQWDPAKKGEGGNSLYGSMLRQFKLAGGKIRGVLWYQGEAEANAESSKIYPKVFADFIAAVRADFEQPELPFYFVQLGRFANPSDPKFWNSVQETQRLLPERIPNTAVVATVDLELDDGIHIGTTGLKRLGARLAGIALREIFGQAGATTPTLDRVSRLGERTLVLKFKGVNRSAFAASSDHVQSYVESNLLKAPSHLPPTAQPLEGLQPPRHIGGFSIRTADGAALPIIFDARVGPSKDTVILKLEQAIPPGAQLWYGYGLDPYCNLTDALDMAVPVFGPIALDDMK